MANPPYSYLLVTSFILSLCAAESVHSPYSGTFVPTSLLRVHFLPDAHHPPATLSALLFERTANGTIISSSPTFHPYSYVSPTRSSLDPVVIAPQVKPVRNTPRYIIDGVRVSLSVAPTMRVGQDHVFAYLDDQLLGAWGPELDLRPIHPVRFPNIFVNVYNASHHSSAALTSSILSPAVKSEHISPSNTISTTLRKATRHHLRPFWDAERELFFDVSLAFDAAFCAIYGGNGTLAAATAHSIGVSAHEMSLTRLVSLRVGDVVGFCSSNTSSPSSFFPDDPFSPPPGAGPGTRLRAFRSAWLAAKEPPVDAVYLLSGTVPTSTVVGAAWVASACSRFAFGYALGTSAIIIAHEMGHTLGAAHLSTGLMQPYLRATKGAREDYAAMSRAQIDAFLRRLEGQGCLVRRHRSAGAGFTGFAQLVSAAHGITVRGTDVAVGSVWTPGEAIVAMLQVHRNKVTGNPFAEFRVTVLSRSTGKGFPFSYVYRYFGAYVPHSHTLDFEAGAGIAVGRLTERRQDDAIIVWIEKGSNLLIYRAAYGISLGDKGVDFDKWSPFRTVNLGITGRVVSLGATAGDTSGTLTEAPDTEAMAPTDLVVAYIEANNATGKAEAKFTVCRDLNGATLFARRGWTRPITIDYALPEDTEDIGDISVAVWNRPMSEGDAWESSLLFALILRNSRTGLWDTLSCTLSLPIADEDAAVKVQVDCHRSKVPAARALRVGGGIALTRLLSPTAPITTSITFHGREFASGGSSTWLDVEDTALTGESREAATVPASQLALTIGEQFVPADTCARCYGATSITTCQRRVRVCFTGRVHGQLNLVHSIRAAGERKVRPKQSSIFCAGFHDVFIAPRNTPCQWTATRTDILAAGVRAVLGGKRTTVRTRRTVLGNGGFGSGYVPTTISVTVWSRKTVRWIVLNKAMAKLRQRGDFRLLFRRKRKDVRVRRSGTSRHTYVITLGFRKQYREAWLKEVVASRHHA